MMSAFADLFYQHRTEIKPLRRRKEILCQGIKQGSKGLTLVITFLTLALPRFYNIKSNKI